MFLRILHLFAVGLHTCTAVARSLCVSWAFLCAFVATAYQTTPNQKIVYLSFHIYHVTTLYFPSDVEMLQFM